jgi:uncharacterized protein YhaN
VAGANADALEGEIATKQAKVADVDQDLRNLAEDKGRLKKELDDLDQAEGAAIVAAELQQNLTHIRGLVRRYARYRLACHLLEQEMQRYLSAHQGPLVDRAGILFKRLTLDQFERLDVRYDSEGMPRLACIRRDEREVPPDRLSDGEADQLYLALRVAALERHLEANVPLPFVADDLLVNFDDDRARAAWEVLGDLAARTQVLFFTHHARLCEVAQEALANGLLRRHDLPR